MIESIIQPLSHAANAVVISLRCHFGCSSDILLATTLLMTTTPARLSSKTTKRLQMTTPTIFRQNGGLPFCFLLWDRGFEGGEVMEHDRKGCERGGQFF